MEMQKVLVLFAIQLAKARALAIKIFLLKSRRKKRKIGVGTIPKTRRQNGYFTTLIPVMRLKDAESFRNFHRMDAKSFDELLRILGPHLKSKPIRKQEFITPAERLSITLRYLASGDSMKSIGFYGFRIGASTTSNIIRETCQLIWQKLQFVFPLPTSDMWENIGNNFNNRWGFPNCLGAIDGKHVTIQAPPNHNSLTFNYKHTHSIVLMAVADDDYKFVLVDIGAMAHNSDSGVFRNSKFGKAILENCNDMNFPAAKQLPGTNVEAPYVFVGDEAFPLRANLLRAYPGRGTGRLPPQQDNFNRRLSRARRVVENSFGILASRFRIYRKPFIASKQTSLNVVKATVCLHNWLRDRASSEYFQKDLIDRENEDGTVNPGLWREEQMDGMRPMARLGSNRASKDAVKIREIFTNYFNLN